ncbi:O-methyltransferase [Thermogemmatispora onikobensis]|uniref:O-methyltransferase n=1 Tax=Thermogemmatispora onikobensis TaxID=732234 RepID=UPI000B0CD9DC|nr:O-methyltransferase [Thermogemmatispora onikobensis]
MSEVREQQPTAEEELLSLRRLVQIQHELEEQINRVFAPEDEALRYALQASAEAGLPQINISPIEGKLLQFLALISRARTILEIGTLGGYSGLWLARALPSDGRLITLEMNPQHASVARRVFEHAGVSERVEIRLGRALDLLPALVNEGAGPFDLVFIDADKPPYPRYLDWALQLSHPGTIIVADNCLRDGRFSREPVDEVTAGIVEYCQRITSDPRLFSLALNIDEGYRDGFTVTLVREG